MLEHGEVPRYVPNWWNPYSHNVGQKDPARKQKLIVIIKLIFVVITMLGGATLALCLNVLRPPDHVIANVPDIEPCLQSSTLSPLNPLKPDKLDREMAWKEPTTSTTTTVTNESKST